ncbi:MAG: GGDEF domain-containing protein [Campylobacterota bacterium]|nr:GGDEF domain-containing protein [Campylobacterota bacterium]
MITNKEENSKKFVFVVLIPLIGITLMFTYAFLYLKDEINFINHEINGLNKIYKVQDIVFDIQKLRGLSNIKNKDENCILGIENLNKTILDKSIKFKEDLQHLKAGTHLKEQFIEFLDKAIHHSKDNNNFEYISQTISDSRLFIENISYHSNLALDSNLKSYILIQTIVLALPDLIEYNGQIRGISSSIKNNKLQKDEKELILILQSKIYDKIKHLEFNMRELNKKNNSDIITTIYSNTISAQNSLLDFVNKELLDKETIMLKSNDIFRLESNNIEFIMLLYKANHKELNKILSNRLEVKYNIISLIVIGAIFSIIFILFINILFYKKNKEYIQKIKQLSITDSMTNLFNRRYFDSEFEKQLKIKGRLKQNLIFIMMDIDHFKQYNDTYGHHKGDEALIAVAKSLKNNLNRPDDMVFRLGGEEFGILCSDMDEKESINFANKLRINIQNLNIEHKKNSASEFVTISMGLIVIKPNFKYEIDSIYKYADEALYEAKHKGRNQVSIYN